jgi:hypothetical protein
VEYVAVLRPGPYGVYIFSIVLYVYAERQASIHLLVSPVNCLLVLLLLLLFWNVLAVESGDEHIDLPSFSTQRDDGCSGPTEAV